MIPTTKLKVLKSKIYKPIQTKSQRTFTVQTGNLKMKREKKTRKTIVEAFH